MEAVRLVSVERWSCSRGASCVVKYIEVEGLVSVERWSCGRGASCVVEYTLGRWRGWSYIVEWWRW